MTDLESPKIQIRKHIPQHCGQYIKSCPVRLAWMKSGMRRTRSVVPSLTCSTTAETGFPETTDTLINFNVSSYIFHTEYDGTASGSRSKCGSGPGFFTFPFPHMLKIFVLLEAQNKKYVFVWSASIV
jgi:hypothetical protein